MNSKLKIVIIVIALLTQACDNCETTYRKEIGVGYVFIYDTSNNISYPVVGAKVIVENMYNTSGLFGKTQIVAEQSYITDADGLYQVRFVEKGCFEKSNNDKEMVYCNTYVFHYEQKRVLGLIGISANDIENNAKNNALKLDTIKLYK